MTATEVDCGLAVKRRGALYDLFPPRDDRITRGNQINLKITTSYSKPNCTPENKSDHHRDHLIALNIFRSAQTFRIIEPSHQIKQTLIQDTHRRRSRPLVWVWGCGTFTWRRSRHAMEHCTLDCTAVPKNTLYCRVLPWNTPYCHVLPCTANLRIPLLYCSVYLATTAVKIARSPQGN